MSEAMLAWIERLRNAPSHKNEQWVRRLNAAKMGLTSGNNASRLGQLPEESEEL